MKFCYLIYFISVVLYTGCSNNKGGDNDNQVGSVKQPGFNMNNKKNALVAHTAKENKTEKEGKLEEQNELRAGAVSVPVSGKVSAESENLEVEIFSKTGIRIANGPVGIKGDFSLDVKPGNDYIIVIRTNDGKTLMRSYIPEIGEDGINDITVNARSSALVYAIEAKLSATFGQSGTYNGKDDLEKISSQIISNANFPALIDSVSSSYLKQNKLNEQEVLLRRQKILSAIKTGSAVLTDINFDSPVRQAMFVSNKKRFEIIGQYSDKSRRRFEQDVKWSSSDSLIARVNNKGLVETFATGLVVITASTDDMSASATIKVKENVPVSIDIIGKNVRIKDNTNHQLKAVMIYSDGKKEDVTSSVMWNSDDMNVAVISNASGCEGLIVSVTKGTTLISASFKSMTASSKIKVF